MSNTPSVVYIEDDADSREVMQLILENIMNVDHFTILEDSTDFLNRLLQLNPAPDLILLDIHVRPYSGFQMLEEIRQQPAFAQARIVALTASVMNEEVQQLKTAGFDSAIGKPIDADTLPDALERILQGETIWRVLR